MKLNQVLILKVQYKKQGRNAVIRFMCPGCGKMSIFNHDERANQYVQCGQCWQNVFAEDFYISVDGI